MRETHNVGANTREWLVHSRICAPLASNHLWLVGLSDAAEGFHFVRPNWPHSQIIVCFGGQGRVWSQNEWRLLRAGEAYIVPRRTLSSYHALPDHRWKLCWVTYDQSLNFSPITSRLVTVRKADPRPLQSAIDGLYRESNGKCEAPALQAWADIIQLYAARIGDQDHHARFWTIWEEVIANLAKPWSVDDLADLANISGEHLRRLCHRQLGRTPVQQLTHLRMHRAATMLVASRSNINTIAASVGYSNRFSFSNAFRREIGQTPGAYRRMHTSS